MLPLRPPGGIFGGIYALPEMQPIYDFENSHFSFWIGPEVLSDGSRKMGFAAAARIQSSR